MELEHNDSEPRTEATVVREPLVDLGIPPASPEERRTGSRPRRRLSDIEAENNETPPSAPAKPPGRPTLALKEPPSESPSTEPSVRPRLADSTEASETPELRPRVPRPRLALTLSPEEMPGLQNILDPPRPSGGTPAEADAAATPTQAAPRDPDFSFALLAGLAAAIVGAMVWALLTMATGLSLGCLAVGLGFLVGGTVRSLGRGHGRAFGGLGAALALFGCLLGSLLSVCTIIAGQEGLSTVGVLVHICSKPALIPAAMIATFHALDPLFYGVAVYAGYRLSFRRVA